MLLRLLLPKSCYSRKPDEMPSSVVLSDGSEDTSFVDVSSSRPSRPDFRSFSISSMLSSGINPQSVGKVNSSCVLTRLEGVQFVESVIDSMPSFEHSSSSSVESVESVDSSSSSVSSVES